MLPPAYASSAWLGKGGTGCARPDTGERKALGPELLDQTRPAGVSAALSTEETPTDCFLGAKEAEGHFKFLTEAKLSRILQPAEGDKSNDVISFNKSLKNYESKERFPLFLIERVKEVDVG